MEAFFIYIAKSSGLVVLFYCSYYFLLRKETFFNSNRWFLMTGLATSLILPFAVYTKIVWIDPIPVSTVNYPQSFIPQTIPQESFEINWDYIFLSVYCIGFVALIIKFATDFYSLNLVLKGKKYNSRLILNLLIYLKILLRSLILITSYTTHQCIQKQN